MPRSLNDPVGFAPSSLSATSAPTRSESTGAGTSGVEPSCSETTGSDAVNGSRSRYLEMSGTLIALDPELLLDHPDRARLRAHEVQARNQLQGGEEPRLEDRVHHHDQPRLV